LLCGKVELTSDLRKYPCVYNKGSLSFLNIECMTTLSKLNALLNVSGLDGIIIGQHDLSVRMGIPE